MNQQLLSESAVFLRSNEDFYDLLVNCFSFTACNFTVLVQCYSFYLVIFMIHQTAVITFSGFECCAVWIGREKDRPGQSAGDREFHHTRFHSDSQPVMGKGKSNFIL